MSVTDAENIVPIGSQPPVGVVPKQMHAQVIRPARYGEPKDAFKIETIDVPSVGAGEAFAEGWWRSPDPAAVIALLIVNQESAQRLDAGTTWLRGLLETLLRPLRDNTRRGSKRNISDHYDLGNDFFELFLDPTMTYSCGVFEDETTSMEQGSIEKLDRICRKLQLDARSEVVEIGTGWGSFALHAAGRYGCRITTTTISERQYEIVVVVIRQP